MNTMKMKRLLVAVLIAACGADGYAQRYDTSLIPYRKGDKWGYCDRNKQVVIAPKFREAAMFEGALAMAKADSDYCVINRRGEIIYQSNSYTGIINDGMHYVTHTNSYTQQLFNEYGKAVTKPYNGIVRFNRYGYMTITSGFVKVGLMDRTFREVLTPAYGSISFLSKDVIAVYEDKAGYSLMHLPDQRRMTEPYGCIYPQHDGLMMVMKDGKYGFIDTTGKVVIAPKYDKETPERIARGERYNESTYENYRYDGFYEGLAVVVQNERAGYIDKSGRVVIPFQFEKAYGFEHGRAWVRQNGKWGMINTSGRLVLPAMHAFPSYLSAKELLALDGFHEGLIPLAKDTVYGYADTNGVMVIPFKFTRAEPFYEGMAAAYKGEQMGFINRSGEWVIPPVYKWAEGVGQTGGGPFVNGHIIALLPSDKWVMLDKKGKQIMPMKFDLDNSIWFGDGLATATSGGKRYLFDTRGRILHTFSTAGYVTQYTPALFYDYDEKCFINVKTKVRYYD